MEGTRRSSALIAAKQTGRELEDPWTSADLYAFLSWRSLSLCEWPNCGSPGEHMAHIFGKGAGGRRSANRPENVIWLCVRHHDVLDGRRRLEFADASSLIGSFPPSPFCAWYCEAAPVDAFAARRFCQLHLEVAGGEPSPHLPATRRRTELGLACAQIAERANRQMGLA